MKKYPVALLIIVLFIILSSSFSFAAKRALLIGVAKYQSLSTSSREGTYNLEGPTNDVIILKNTLISRYGFSEKEIKILKNDEATRQNIEKAFDEWLLKGTKRGDMVVFYFSGHGSRTPKDGKYNGDDKTKYYNFILPYDTIPYGGYNTIVNEKLGWWLRRLEDRTVTVKLDCCFSGGMVRKIGGRSVSQLEDTPIRVKFFPITNYKPSPIVKAIPKGTDITADVFMAASKDNEKAWDYKFPQGYYGAFTFALHEGMKNLPKPSYKTVYEYAKKVVMDRLQLPQEPQLTAKKDIVVMPFLEPPIKEESKPPVPPKIDNKPAAPPEIKGDKVLVAIEGIKGMRPEDMNKLKDGIYKLGNASLVEKKDFYDRLIRGEKKDGKYHVRLLNLVGDAEKIEPVSSIEALTNQIRQRIDYAYMLKQLARIHNPNPQFNIKLSVTDENRRDFMIGEKVVFKVEAEKDCYILLINMDSKGNFHIIYPNKFHKDNFVKADAEVVVPDDEMRRRKFEFEFALPAGEETVKVIAATKPLDLEKLGIADFKEAFPVVRGNTRIIKVIERINNNIENESSGDNKFEWAEDTVVVRSHE